MRKERSRVAMSEGRDMNGVDMEHGYQDLRQNSSRPG